jgi:nitrogen regulatory protein PII
MVEHISEAASDAIFQTDTKLIACILPKGGARALQRALIEKKQIHTGNFHYGRGVGRDSRIQDRGIGEQQEREIFEVIVPASQADEIFEFIFFEAEMGEPHGGMIHMTQLTKSSVMTLPDVPSQED